MFPPRLELSTPRLKGLVALVSLLAFSYLLPGVPAAAATESPSAAPSRYRSGEILVGWNPGSGPVPLVSRAPGVLEEDRSAPQWQAAADALERATGLVVLDAQPHYGYARLRTPEGRELAEIARLQGVPWVKYAEPNYIARAAGEGGFYPTDPQIGQQWHLRRVDAPQAWAITRGSLSFVVATLDSGVDRTHPDLAGRLLPGRNYVANGSLYPDDDTPDSHGTHVAGIIAATANNATGVAGVATEVRLLPLKVLDRDGAAAYSDIAEALYYAADYGAQVINMSLGGLDDSAVLADAVYYALGKGALIVAAAGNCATESDECGPANPNVYPAAYPGVLAVGASDHYDRWAPYSGYKSYIALAAPGGTAYDAVFSTVRGGYGYLYGSSMATPIVSGTAALVWTLSPALSYSQVTEVLKTTADKVGTFATTGVPIPYTNGRNEYFGYGRLNAGRAVRWVLTPSISATTAALRIFAGGGAHQTRTVTLSNPSDQTIWWQANVLQGAGWLRVSTPTGTAWSGASSELLIAVGPAGGGAWPAPGTHTGLIRVQPVYPAGLPAIDITVELRVSATSWQSYLPAAANDSHLPAWLDPNNSASLERRSLYLQDDTFAALSLPFPISFYGGFYTTVNVSDNGYVVVGQRQPGDNRAPGGCLRTAEAPNSAVYANAADWKPGLGGEITAHRPDVDTYVITWDGMRTSTGGASQSFQLVFRRDAPIRSYYRTASTSGMGIVGAEYYDGTLADQVYCPGIGRPPKAGETVVFDTTVPW